MLQNTYPCRYTLDGAIPVTLIKYKKEHKFFNQSFEFKELDSEISALLEKS